VEFVFDNGEKTIQFRSASRLGYGDMGVNRKRMETIRENLILRMNAARKNEYQYSGILKYVSPNQSAYDT